MIKREFSKWNKKCPCYAPSLSTILCLSLFAVSYSLFVSMLLITYWASTKGPLLTKKEAGRIVNPLRSLWFTHPTSRPVDLPLYLGPSVGCIQPSMVLLDQPWKLYVLWPQRRLDPRSWRNLAPAASVAPRYDSLQWDNVLVVEL